MPKKIIDEFSDLPVARQRKTQLRYKRDGKCVVCGQPVVTKTYCLKHALGARERERKRMGFKRRIRSLTDRIGEKEINDEFTPLPLPYSKKMELRYKRDGKCIRCGGALATKRYCLKHAEARREAQRRRNGSKRRNNNALSYRSAAKRARRKTQKA